MSASVLPATLAIPRPTNRPFSSLRALTGGEPLQFRLRHLSIEPAGGNPLRCPPVRMGGGPRTFPGGVSKWQWKRMQAKKAKQLLKARLLRERQIYEMRKRAELKAAVSELERPWEVVERGPNLFSVSADEQVKALADRFQRPGGFDMWSERDGPQLFRAPDGLPSARFFPKGAVHSVKPYGVVADGSDEDGKEELRFDDWISRGGGGARRSSRRSSRRGAVVDVESGDSAQGSDPKDSHLGTRNASLNATSYGSSRVRGGDERRQGFEEVGQFGLDADAIGKDRGKNGKMVGRRGYARGNRGVKAGRISLRPTTDLYSEEDGYGTRHSRGSGGSREVKLERVSPRPTTDLYSGEDGYGRRHSRGRGGNGFKTNHARSL